MTHRFSSVRAETRYFVTLGSRQMPRLGATAAGIAAGAAAEAAAAPSATESAAAAAGPQNDIAAAGAAAATAVAHRGGTVAAVAAAAQGSEAAALVRPVTMGPQARGHSFAVASFPASRRRRADPGHPCFNSGSRGCPELALR